MRRSTWLALLALMGALLLAGCASTPSGPRPNATAPAAGSSRHGAYYQDDGPGDNPPENLDQLPDAVPRVEPYASGANRPYVVFGREYVPDTSDRPFTEHGIASWYGRKFNGQRTASGEIYDMYSMTAAHPTLPIPSYVRVTNPANGRSVIVRVNDRGPFHPGRIIDLSYAAAYRLGFAGMGSTSVELERLLPRDIAAGRFGSGAPIQLARDAQRLPGPAAPPVTAPAAPTASAMNAPSVTSAPAAPAAAVSAGAVAMADDLPADLVPASARTPPDSTRPAAGAELPVSGHYLQLAAFRVRSGAEGFLQHLALELDPALAGRLRILSSESFYRVQLGPYADRSEAEGAAARLRDDLGIAPVIVAPQRP
jgi:rare lipoprotein A